MTYTASTATQALGRVLGPSGEPRDGGAAIELPAHLPGAQAQQKAASEQEMLPTGIKVIDLIAPIRRGGLITMVAGAGVGKVVATSEIVHNLAERQNGRGVFVVLADQQYPLNELLADLRAGGIDASIALVSVQQDDSPEQYQRAVQTGRALAQGLAASGHEVLFCLSEPLLTAPIDTFPGLPSITTVVWQYVSIEGDAELPDNPLFQERDGQLVFNTTLARNSIWPAIDPVRSGSRLLDKQKVTASHWQVAQSTRELLGQHEVLLGGKQSDRGSSERARRVLQFQTQPFFVAEPFTARPGVWVPIEQTIASYQALLDGRHDQRTEEELRFLGALPT